MRTTRTVIIYGQQRVTLRGFPFGTPKINEPIEIDFGLAVCTGRAESSVDRELWEIQLTILSRDHVTDGFETM